MMRNLTFDFSSKKLRKCSKNYLKNQKNLHRFPETLFLHRQNLGFILHAHSICLYKNNVLATQELCFGNAAPSFLLF